MSEWKLKNSCHLGCDSVAGLQVPNKCEGHEEPQSTVCHILEDLNRKLHHCENHKSKKLQVLMY